MKRLEVKMHGNRIDVPWYESLHDDDLTIRFCESNMNTSYLRNTCQCERQRPTFLIYEKNNGKISRSNHINMNSNNPTWFCYRFPGNNCDLNLNIYYIKAVEHKLLSSYSVLRAVGITSCIGAATIAGLPFAGVGAVLGAVVGGFTCPEHVGNFVDNHIPKMNEHSHRLEKEMKNKGYATIDGSQVILKDGRCGSKYGSCPSGQCCSKYGYCGKSSDFCGSGCQSSYDKCNSNSGYSSSSVSKDGRCGPGYGSCPSNKCCSKYGYCNTGSDHCSIDKGCQSSYGRCDSKSSSISTNGRCGSKYGKCPSGKCCSKYGYCGTSDVHCLASNGCQSSYGNCKNNKSNNSKTKISQDGKCGNIKGINYICPDGKCCSKEGYCGHNKNYCNEEKGCQSSYGKCGRISDKAGYCGSKYGLCGKVGECCSKYGYCGTSSSYCGSNCQTKYGKCNSSNGN